MDALPVSHLGSQISLHLHLDEDQQLSAYKGGETLWNISHSLSSLSISSLSLSVLPLSLSSGWGGILPFPQDDGPSPFSSWPSILPGQHHQDLFFWGSASPLRTTHALLCVLEEGRGAGYGYYNPVSASLHEQCCSLLFPE